MMEAHLGIPCLVVDKQTDWCMVSHSVLVLFCFARFFLSSNSYFIQLTTLPSFPTSISAIAFNHDGSEAAIASSYTFEDGDREHPQDELFIRKILESECLPKPKD
jgi:hypothetical protein